MTEYFIQAFIYLTAAVVAVPLAKRWGLGSVLGYLIAGIIIGPVIGLVGEETATLQHFAEFGVVMMLFLVGLELEPRMLWDMRNRLIGLGGLQVGLTAGLIALAAIGFGLDWRVALTIGLTLALSSTAIVLQTLNEKGLTKTEGGRNGFSILLFQDIAVIPMLALIPLLELPGLAANAKQLVTETADHHGLDLVSGLPNWAYAVVVLGAIAGVIFGGHFLGRPLFRYVANSKLREVFTATTLMLVIGIAALMSLVGLSPALGTFIAGVVLANSEFRHELESSLEPFKGLLLGLFFITVGAGINFHVLNDNLAVVAGVTLGIMFIKALVLYGLALLFRIQNSHRWLVTLSLAQAGEFGFVLLSFSTQNHVLSPQIAQLLSLVVALSMLLSPLLFIFFDKVLLPRYESSNNQREPDEIDEKGQVLIAGMGRFGQIVNRMLVANGVKTTILDHESAQVETLRLFGVKGYYGDATRPDLLQIAGIEEASLFVITIDNRERVTELVSYVKQHYPDLPVLVRAFDEGHLYQLRQAGADHIVKETFHSALELGVQALTDLGHHPFRAHRARAIFHQTEKKLTDDFFAAWKTTTKKGSINTNYRDLFKQQEVALHEAMKQDRIDGHSGTERGWTPPPKGYIKDMGYEDT